MITEDLKGKQQIDQQSATQSIGGGFALPDLNIPVQDAADGSVHWALQISAALLTE